MEFSVERFDLIDDLSAATIEFTFAPAKADTSKLTLTSSDPDVFIVTAGGRVEAVAPGEARLIAKDGSRELASIPVTVEPVRMFSIGNSHTWDFQPSWSFRFMAEHLGITLENDWHIFCSNGIPQIIAEPERTCNESVHGDYRVALDAMEYQIITLQPFWRGTAKQEADGIEQMLDFIATTASRDAKVYIYYTWPKNTVTPYAEFQYRAVWNQTPFAPNTDFMVNAGFVQYLEDRFGDDPRIAGFIPAGEAMFEFDRAARNGEITGFVSAGDLYRDDLHMNNGGKFLAASTVLFSLFPHIEIADYDLPKFHAGKRAEYDRDLTPEMRKQFMDVARRAIAAQGESR
ncbi:MAG: hypothetical protein WBA68_05370 [Alteraurantiacibacter sp.]